MEIKITKDSSNKVTEAREIEFVVVQEGSTYSREEIKMELCKKLSLDPESTIVTRISQRFGVRQSTCSAHVYKSKEVLATHEPKHIVERLSKGKDKPAADAAGKEEAKKE